MTAEPNGGAARRWAIAGIIAAVALVVLVPAFVVTARITDRPIFCARCHEMQPYYAAWLVGKHHGHAECIDCHVGTGTAWRLEHKFYVLPEIWAHFTGDTSFPRARIPDIPDSRCIGCHPTVSVTSIKGFSHEFHARQGRCANCHPLTGHDVTEQALSSAGILNSANWTLRTTLPYGVVAAPGAGKADLPGHPKVVCSGCHDMAALPCGSCHIPPHEARGACSDCHNPGPRFTFTHPRTTMPNWQRIACKKCHPTDYRHVTCTCHRNGIPQGD